MTAPSIDIDLFAGPGGWDEGGLRLGLRPVGFEWDEAACLTAVAAGHLRVRADVSRTPCAHMRGKVRGLIISAPCTPFSAAGKGAGRLVLAILVTAIRATFAGHNMVGETRRRVARVVKPTYHAKATRTQRAAGARRQAFITCLTLEIPRWIRDTDPEWIALENVPAIRPVFQVIAHELRQRGYSVWTGELNAADYGVPQTRKREILIASRLRAVTAPEPTHAKSPEPTLFGQLKHWISMASALGWGATARPVPTVTAGGTGAGGAEPIARGGRDALTREREEVGSIAYRLHRGAGMNERHGDRPDTSIEGPAPVITSKARTATWVVDRRTNSKAAGGA
jgi:DNA (cytosine-5)-methyltransferase 1